MSVTEIILLIAGLLIFVASFVIPEKVSGLQEIDGELAEKEIRKIAEQEMENAKAKINDIVEETVSYAVEKTERSLERVSNEKMMAVNEYADTVLTDINKNHQEVMFLYDMLNDKHQNLKNTVAQVDKTSKAVQEKAKDAMATVREAEETVREAGKTVQKVQLGQELEDFEPLHAEAIDISMLTKKKTPARKNTKTTKRQKTTATKSEVQADKTETSGEVTKQNSNEKILELHNAGKSTISIAQELGLGVGEVNLVLDLFQGKK
ncbi:MAG: DUF6115 domain-containing protein [Lachnospiraceae bacterium]|nr:DUF6115 domain-containing protein [Lachnospiraceae bacterium]